LRERYLASGHRHIGWKAGLTSRAKMRQMGVDQPIVGFLTQKMAAAPGSVIEVANHVHPRVECEVAFVLSADLPSEGCTVEHVLEATEFVVPAIEMIDSRYQNFKFDLASVIADNTSTARFILGSNGMRLSDLDRKTLGVALLRNGEVMATGASAAVWGDPAASVALVANIVGSVGGRLEAGMTVMSGGITAAFAVSPGDCVSARFQKLGNVDIRFA
jgi:2-oxo-3-hexenedioate decarboxylase